MVSAALPQPSACCLLGCNARSRAPACRLSPYPYPCPFAPPPPPPPLSCPPPPILSPPSPAGVTLKGDFKVNDLSVDKLELAAGKLNLEFSTVLSGVKASLKATDGFTGSQDITSNLVLDYTTKEVASSMDVALLKDALTTQVSAVFSPAAGFLLGFNTELSPKNFNPATKLNLALGYKTKDYAFGAVTSKAFKTVEVGFHAKASSEVTVAATLSGPIPTGKAADSAITAAAGLQYKPTDSATITAKADQAGKVAVAFAHVLSPLATVTWATEIDTVNIATNNHSEWGGAVAAAAALPLPPHTPTLTPPPTPPLPPLPPLPRVWHPAVHQGINSKCTPPSRKAPFAVKWKKHNTFRG